MQPLFRALADPTRREILALLHKGDLTIGQITHHFPMTRAAIKKHLNILEDGDLITTTKQGRERLNRATPAALAPLRKWIASFDTLQEDRLAALKRSIAKEWKT